MESVRLSTHQIYLKCIAQKIVDPYRSESVLLRESGEMFVVRLGCQLLFCWWLSRGLAAHFGRIYSSFPSIGFPIGLVELLAPSPMISFEGPTNPVTA